MDSERFLRIRHTFVEGLFQRYLAADQKDARTLFYVHGLGESGLGFESLITDPRLAAYNHLVVDLPGYGKSPWPEEPLGLDDQARFLADWLERTNAPPVVVVGHSMGGVVGTLLCELAGSRVEAFVNIEGNISSDDCVYSAMIASITESDWYCGGFESIWDALYDQGKEETAARTYYPSLRFCDPRLYYKNSHELVERSAPGDLAARLGKLDIPKIYLLGDPQGTGEASRKLLEKAGVEWRAVSPAGHWPWVDQPEDFVALLVDFLVD